MQLNQTKRFNNRMGDGFFMFWGLVSVVIFALLVLFGLVLGLFSGGGGGAGGCLLLCLWGGGGVSVLVLLFPCLFCCFVLGF